MSSPNASVVHPLAGVTPDFNNDGIPDSVVVDDVEGWDDNDSDYLTEPQLWQYLDPYINGIRPNESFSLLDLFWCKPPTVTRDNTKLEGTTAWAVARNSLWREILWNVPFMRFFNSDRSMFFKAGQEVALRGDPQNHVILESPVVFFSPRKVIQVGGIYALLSGCRFVPLDDLIWLTKKGEPLDMRRAITLARQEGPLSDNVAKTLEERVAIVIRGAMKTLKMSPSGATSETMRNMVVDSVKKSFGVTDLPDGWEASLLFALNLPQIKWPEFKPHRRVCGYPPQANRNKR